MINIQIAEAIADKSEVQLIQTELLEHSAQEALMVAGSPHETELTIVISDDEQLQALNSQYLGIEAPTDVLSFPANETDPESGGIYLGDIIISYPRAQAQAQAGGHALVDELQLLVVHGVLHLLGHDHSNEVEQARMWSIQSEILRRLGCSIIAPPAAES